MKLIDLCKFMIIEMIKIKQIMDQYLIFLLILHRYIKKMKHLLFNPKEIKDTIFLINKIKLKIKLSLSNPIFIIVKLKKINFQIIVIIIHI